MNTWGAYLAKTSSFWIHGGDILPRKGVFPVRDSFGNALGRYLPGIPPSSARSAPRGCFIQRARLRLSEMSLENVSSRNVALRLFGNALQRCFVRGPSSAQANERWLLRCSAHVGLPLRCRGALGDAALRSFGHRMSPLTRMAAERAEHEQVQVQVRARARMPLLPPALQGFGGRLAHRVLHGADVLLGHRVPKGVDVLGHRALRTLASGSAAM